jgi:hypothetical protein
MNLSSKIALALLAGSTAATVGYPMVASALPATGSTAAAVSIKFQDTGATVGNATLNPGGTTNATGNNGVKELSAAVATGESTAKANSSSGSSTSVIVGNTLVGTNTVGTSASAEGFSQPVKFSYTNTSDVSNVRNYSEIRNNNTDTLATSKETLDSFKKNSSEANSGSDKKTGDLATVNNTTTKGTTFGDSKETNNPGSLVTADKTGTASGGTGTAVSASNRTEKNGTLSPAGNSTTNDSIASNVNNAASLTNNSTSEKTSNQQLSSNINKSGSSSTTTDNTATNTKTEKTLADASSNNQKNNNEETFKTGKDTNNTNKSFVNSNIQDNNNNSVNTKVIYNYEGSSAGLGYIPVLK